jgi:hypothetical protein
MLAVNASVPRFRNLAESFYLSRLRPQVSTESAVEPIQSDVSPTGECAAKLAAVVSRQLLSSWVHPL